LDLSTLELTAVTLFSYPNQANGSAKEALIESTDVDKEGRIISYFQLDIYGHTRFASLSFFTHIGRNKGNAKRLEGSVYFFGA
jgi:hypothetical protein